MSQGFITSTYCSSQTGKHPEQFSIFSQGYKLMEPALQATQETAKASRLSTTPVHTCMSSVKSLSEPPAIVSAHCQHGRGIDSVETGCHGSKGASSARASIPVQPQSLRSDSKASRTECPRTWGVLHSARSHTRSVSSWKADQGPDGDTDEEMAAVLSAKLECGWDQVLFVKIRTDSY